MATEKTSPADEYFPYTAAARQPTNKYVPKNAPAAAPLGPNADPAAIPIGAKSIFRFLKDFLINFNFFLSIELTINSIFEIKQKINISICDVFSFLKTVLQALIIASLFNQTTN